MPNKTPLNVILHALDLGDPALSFPKHLSASELFTFLQFSVECAADEVFWMKSDSSIFYVNDSACNKLGYESSELVGMRVWEWDPLFPKEVWPTFWSELKEKKHLDFETQHKDKNGTVFPVNIKAHFLAYGDEEFLFAFVTDITAKKEYETKLSDYNNQLKLEVESQTKKLAEEKERVSDYACKLEGLVGELKESAKKNEALREELLKQARTDALTGLFNRRYFDELAEQEISRANRYNSPLSCIMIDIDDFKKVNDKLGHLVGDEVIRLIAKLVESRIRQTDFCARWGGEEFIVFLPNTSLETAKVLAEDLREIVAKQSFERLDQITISLGIAEYHFTDNREALINSADKALYRAKSGGRNRIEVCHKHSMQRYSVSNQANPS